MPEPVLIPGVRDVRGSLDGADDAGTTGADAGEATVVVACPPHPRHGGTRNDERLRALSDRLATHGIDCLRFDYGEWDDGYGEREDVENVIRWTADRYDRVGVFGYSFGGAVALLAAADCDRTLGGVSVLAPQARVNDELDAAAAIEDVEAPTQVVYGARDTTVDWQTLVDRARATGCEVVELPADHSFVGRRKQSADASAQFLTAEL